MNTSNLYNELHRLFTISNGKLVRKVQTSSNALKGDVAGWFDESSGYYRVRVNRKPYLVHRLIYLMVYKHLPEIVDHKDTNPLNNLPENLRAATSSQNRVNSKVTYAKSGYKGVYKDGNRWKGIAHSNKRRYYLGMFTTVLEAAKAVDKKNKELHGEFYQSIIGDLK